MNNSKPKKQTNSSKQKTQSSTKKEINKPSTTKKVVNETENLNKKIEKMAKETIEQSKEKTDETKFSVYDIGEMSNEEFNKKIELIKIADYNMTNEEFVERAKKARHKWEIPIFVLSTIISLGIYGLVAYFATMAASEESFRKELMNLLDIDKAAVEDLIQYGSNALIIVVIILLYNILKLNSRYLGWSSIHTVRLSDSKYEDIYAEYVNTCKLLGFNRVPNVYVSKSDFDNNFKGLKIRSTHGISLPYDMAVKATETGNYSEVEYLVAKRLSRIYLGHNGTLVILLTLWARYIPILSNLINRVCTYSVDKMTSVILGRIAFLEHIYNENISDDGYDEADKEDVVKLQLKCSKEEDLGRFFENLVSDEPFPIYRIEAVLKDIDGKLF